MKRILIAAVIFAASPAFALPGSMEAGKALTDVAYINDSGHGSRLGNVEISAPAVPEPDRAAAPAAGLTASPEHTDWAGLRLTNEAAAAEFAVAETSFERGALEELLARRKNEIFPIAPPSPEEWAAVDYYKKDMGVYDINSFLRGKRDGLKYTPEAIMAMARLAASALNRMPAALLCKENPVYRGARLGDDVLAGYIPGLTVVEKGFTSTSRNRRIAEVFAAGAEHYGKKKALFVIHTATGKVITAGIEAEVLIRPFTVFKVLKKQIDASNFVVIEMAEVRN